MGLYIYITPFITASPRTPRGQRQPLRTHLAAKASQHAQAPDYSSSESHRCFGIQHHCHWTTITTVSTNQAKGHRAINLLASLRSWTRMSNNLIATTDSATDKVHWDFDRLNRNTSIPLHKIDPHYAWHGYMKAIPFKREGWSCGGHQLSPSLIWIVAAVFLW